MQRVKNIEYDDDDYYSDGEEGYAEEAQAYTAEDRENFATYTPVVRAELEEAGYQVSDKQIEDALWHYYWDVGKSVAYLKNARTPRPQQQSTKKVKVKSKFDQAAENNAAKAGESSLLSPLPSSRSWPGQTSYTDRRGLPSTTSASHWFTDTPWSKLPSYMESQMIPVLQTCRPKLLGGSSKLAKLAEERRKKVAASQTLQAAPNGALSSLDRLSRPKDAKENESPGVRTAPKKYPIRKRKTPSPPRKEPSPPPPEEDQDDFPDLRSSPTHFGLTLSVNPCPENAPDNITLKDVLGHSSSDEPFKGPSPDDNVKRAQQHSKALNK